MMSVELFFFFVFPKKLRRSFFVCTFLRSRSALLLSARKTPFGCEKASVERDRHTHTQRERERERERERGKDGRKESEAT